MTMPTMTGDQLARKIMEIKPALPIIVCTGFSERISLEKLTAIGVKALLMKPIIKSKMAITVRKVLEAKAINTRRNDKNV
jgi:CheY-like chemotaxis protein